MDRLAHAQAPDQGANLLTVPIRSLLKRKPVTISPDLSIRAAAELMRSQRVSSVLIERDGLLFGLVTDRDLRNRVIAEGVNSSRPVVDIATLAPLTIQANGLAFDALLLMARNNIHHVPVVDGQRIVGMVTATDVNEQQSSSAVFLAGDIHKQTSLEGLVTAAARIRPMQQQLAAAEATAYSTGHIVTTITDALTARLLQLAELELGPAPVDFAWVAAGSQARNEQTAKSDQDNCMVLDDGYDEAQHGEYFKALSRYVCDGLNACGYVYCPGEMMAMTDKWRQPHARWLKYFEGWTGQPEPMALMLTCVFFDLRSVAGKAELLTSLRRRVLDQTKGNSIFLTYMVGNALKHQPPLNLFGNLSLIDKGEHKGRIDLKHSGIVPVVDLARIYALAAGLEAVNTHDRLAAAADCGDISPQSARDLRDALEFMSLMRIQHQARRMNDGFEADNHLSPEELSNFDRRHLKDAFSVVKTLQNVLAQRHQGGRF